MIVMNILNSEQAMARLTEHMSERYARALLKHVDRERKATTTEEFGSLTVKRVDGGYIIR